MFKAVALAASLTYSSVNSIPVTLVTEFKNSSMLQLMTKARTAKNSR